MPETVLYIRGALPFGPEYGVPDGLIRDAKILLNIEPDVISSIRQELHSFPGFLDRETIERILHSHIDDEESCRSLARLIAGIDDRLRATGQTVENFFALIEAWRADENNQQKDLLSEEELHELRERLPLIVGPFPGSERQAKAERLAEATGMPLEKIEIICDLRPVFDQGRDTVEGIIPYTTLRIVCKGADGLPVALESILSYDDVTQLAKASADAKKKLKKLRQLVQEKELPIPCVGMTLEGDEK